MIHNVDSFGNETVIQINIDMFTLQIYALMMCKGTVKEKAYYLYDLIIGASQNKDEDEPEQVACTSGRMKSAFKKMIFFSEIFPKKYQSQFLKELLTHQIKNIKSKRDNGNKSSISKPINMDTNYRNVNIEGSNTPKSVHSDLSFQFQ